MITLAMLQKRWPKGNTRVPGLVEGIVASAPAVFEKYGLTTPLSVAHAMAQFSHECGAGTEMVENLHYSASGLMKTWPTRFNSDRAIALANKPEAIADAAYNGRMGNRTGSDDGWNFRGRGLSQCTGRDGYQTLSKKVGIDLVAKPDLINDPVHALECGVADFIICGCLPFAEKDDILMVTQRLNGGTIGLTDRKMWLVMWKKDLAVGAIA